MGDGQEEPWSLSVVTMRLQSLRVTLSTPAPCWPGPSKSTRLTNSSFRQIGEKDFQLGASSVQILHVDCQPHLEGPAPCPEKNLLYCPAPTAAAWGLPQQLPEAILHYNQCQEAW